VSESGFTSKQRKRVIYGREKHRNRRNNRKAKGRKIGKERERRDCAATLSDLSFNLSGLRGPNRSIKTPASIAIWITEVHNPPIRKGDSTRGGFKVDDTLLFNYQTRHTSAIKVLLGLLLQFCQ